MASRALLEPVDWMLFSLGGLIAAFLMPAHILATNIAGPLGLLGGVEYSRLTAKLAHPVAKIYFLAALAGTLLFAQHRIRFVLYDLGLLKHRRAVDAFVLMLDALSFALLVYGILSVP